MSLKARIALVTAAVEAKYPDASGVDVYESSVQFRDGATLRTVQVHSGAAGLTLGRELSAVTVVETTLTDMALSVVTSALSGDAVTSRNQLRALAEQALKPGPLVRDLVDGVVVAADRWSVLIAADLAGVREAVGEGAPDVTRRFTVVTAELPAETQESYRGQVRAGVQALVPIWVGLSERAQAIAGYGGAKKPRGALAEGLPGLVDCTRTVATGLKSLLDLAEMVAVSDLAVAHDAVCKITKDAADVVSFIERTLDGRGA